ncbi:MAG: zf-HC2 domain-containing protein [Chloroflexi bacterium]|nr:zf-HC2 domain-containing protein [Chloroflexota bacterium]
MDHREVYNRLDAYLDEELDSTEQATVAVHLSTCAACQDALAARREMKYTLRSELQAIKAPTGLQRRINKALDAHGEKREPWYAVFLPRLWRFRPALTGLVVLLILLAPVVFWTLSTGTAEAAMVREMVDKHMMYGMLPEPAEMPTDDPQKAADWLSAWVGSPVHPLPPEAGMRLLGARLADMHGMKIGYLIYERSDGERVSFFEVPLSSMPFPKGDAMDMDGHEVYLAQASGYQVALMPMDQKNYAVIAKADAHDLAAMLVKLAE